MDFILDGKNDLYRVDFKYKKENEKKIIRFSAQYHAMTFYEMLGYSKDNDNIFVEVGIEHISMSKIV